MAEESVRVGELELVYETIGDAGDPPLLLVMGLGGQLIHWDLELLSLIHILTLPTKLEV
jgi:pimeloyl-ACP methyl ester carboxylesterase